VPTYFFQRYGRLRIGSAYFCTSGAYDVSYTQSKQVVSKYLQTLFKRVQIITVIYKQDRIVASPTQPGERKKIQVGPNIYYRFESLK